MNFLNLRIFAARYSELGIATFPIWDKWKVPRKGSHGFLDATTDSEEFFYLSLRLFDRWADLGIGLRTGDPLPDGGYLICLDVDEKNDKSGSETLDRRGFEVPNTWWSDTRSGGRHYYFRSERPIKSQGQWLGKDSGLDIRGTGGYTVEAPTTGYVWNGKLSLEGLLPAPKWLTNRTERSTKGNGNGNVDNRELVCCPVHEDSTPSLQITYLKDGTRLYHCFAGCEWGKIALILDKEQS